MKAEDFPMFFWSIEIKLKKIWSNNSLYKNLQYSINKDSINNANNWDNKIMEKNMADIFGLNWKNGYLRIN